MDDILQRKEGENNLDYIKRLTYGKLVDKTIDNDYVELAPLIFNQELSSCECRKRLYGVKSILDLIQNEEIDDIEDKEALEKVNDKILELKKERIKLQTTKNELNKNLRIDSRFELLYENIKNTIKVTETPKFNPIINTDNNEEGTYLLNFSDIHYGSTFKSINNEYSREICKERFDKLLNETIKYIQDNNVNKLLVLNNGDSLQGLLRINDLRMNDIPIVEALVEFCKLMSSFLNELSKYAYVEYYHVPSANHTQLRLLNSKASELATEDMEKIIVNYIHDSLINNERIYVYTDFKYDFIELNIEDFNIIAMHGHQVRSVNSIVKDIGQRQRRFIDYVFLGHFHGGMNKTVGESDNGNIEVIVSSSFIGSCPYSDKLFVGGKAMAKIYKFTKESGIDSIKNIILN